MTNTFKLSCALLWLMIFTGTSHAVEVKDLYLVKWPVAEQSKSVRWKAALSGFKEVLVRKSGSTSILQSNEVQQAYKKVTNYLQRFEYARQSETHGALPYLLSLYFEPRLIDELIQNAQMPLWGANRPVTIMWIAVEEGYKRRILKDNLVMEPSQTTVIGNELIVQKSLEEGIQENAVRRGIPVILPLMDLDDELIVSMSDIWGLFPSTVAEASQRYSADSVLFGRIRQQGEKWYGNFGYINQKDEFNFEVVSETSQQVVTEVINKLSELLCNKYCVIEEVGQKNEIIMKLSGVNNFSEFKISESYLKSLSSLEKIEVVKIEEYQVIYKLTLLGQIKSLIEGIGLSRKMVVDEPSEKQALKKLLEQQERQQEQELNQQVLENNELPSSNLNHLSNDRLLPSNEKAPVFDLEGNEIKTNNTIESEKKQNEQSKIKLKTIYYRWIG